MVLNRNKKKGIWIILLLGVLGGVIVAGATTFLELTDTPSSYSNLSFYPVSINSSGDGLNFTPIIRVESVASVYENRSNLTFYHNGSIDLFIDPIQLSSYSFLPTVSRSIENNGWRITGQDSYCSGRTCKDYYEVCELTGVKRDFPVVYFVEELKPVGMYEWKDVVYTRDVWVPTTFVDENGTTKYSDTGTTINEDYTIPQWKKLAGYLISEGTAVGNTLEGTITIGKNECKLFRFDTPALLGGSYKSGLTYLDPLINNTWYFIGNSTNTSNLWNVDMNTTETTVTLTNSNKTFELSTGSVPSSLTENNTFYWSFDDDEITGDNPDDITGNGWDGTSYNTPTTSEVGVINQAFKYDLATLERTRVDGVNNFRASHFSIAMWFKCDVVGGGCSANKNILGIRRDSGATGTLMLFQPNYFDTRMFLRIRDDSGNQLAPDWYSTATNTGDEEWHYMVLSANATNVTLYINGSYDSSRTNTFGGNVTMTFGEFCVNCDPYLAGDRQENDAYYDEVSVWNRTLSSAEVKTLYNSYAGEQYPYSTTAYNVSANKYSSLPINLNNKTSSVTVYYNWTGTSNMNVTIQVTCDYYNTTPTYYSITSQGQTNNCPNTQGAIQYNITLDGTSAETPVMEWLNITTTITPPPLPPTVPSPRFSIKDENKTNKFAVPKDRSGFYLWDSSNVEWFCSINTTGGINCE